MRYFKIKVNNLYQEEITLAQKEFLEKNFSKALKIIKSILDKNPKDKKARELLAYIYANQNQNKRCLEILRSLIKEPECNPKIYYEYAMLLFEEENYDEVIFYLKKAEYHYPNSTEINAQMGLAYANKGDYKNALISFQNALAFGLDSSELHFNIGQSYERLMLYPLAIESYIHAVNKNTEFLSAWISLSLCASYLNRYDLAKEAYKNILRINPSEPYVYGEYLHLLMQLCNWNNLEQEINLVQKKINENIKVITPFSTLSIFDSLDTINKVTKLFLDEKYPENKILGEVNSSFNENSKLKIAYFSADFNNHALAILISELIELHDKSSFETYGFSVGHSDNLGYQSRLQKSFDHFFDGSQMLDIDIARFCRAKGIHIAVDLGGLTHNSRLGIFSYRAAPVQISYLGYLAGLGVSYIDYLIADNYLIPNHLRPMYHEKIIYLPSYQVNDRKRLLPRSLSIKSDYGIDENQFVYCCFNNNYKLNPIMFNLWIEILKKTDNTVLMICISGAESKENVFDYFLKSNLSHSRLKIVDRVGLSEYLSRFGAADLFLDTYPYNAGTTASDCLQMGLPIVTKSGRSFSSRIAGSILHAAGLSELITYSDVEYVELAVRIAKEPNYLKGIKAKIAGLENTLLMNTPLFIEKLELAFKAAYNNYSFDKKLSDIKIH